MAAYQPGDRVVGRPGSTGVAGVKGVVRGFKKTLVRVEFEGEVGVKKVAATDVMSLADYKEERKRRKKEKQDAGLIKVEVTDLPPQPPANGVSDDEDDTPAPLPAPPASTEPTQPAEEVDLAALHLLYAREGFGVMSLKGHSVGGSWQIKAPTEVGVAAFAKGLNKMSPWYRRAISANPEKPDFRAAAIQCGDEPLLEAQRKANAYLPKAQALPLNPPATVSELLASQDTIGQLDPYYYEFRGEWRKCVVFKSESGDSSRHPIWLLTRGPRGWTPDVRVGVLVVDRSSIYTKDSRNVEMSLRKAEVADVTRRAITLGDIFPSVPALERALLYFPQCFLPPAKDAPNDEGVQARFAVRETIPHAPLPQYGHHPSWLPGSYRIAFDQSVSFVPDTPTGGPLVSSPSWPDGVSDVCVECKRLVDPTAPGGNKGGTVLPGFVGRPNLKDPKKTDFLHTRTCVFAHHERTLSHFSFTWKSGPGGMDGGLKGVGDIGSQRQMRTNVITLPVDRRRDYSAKMQKVEDNVWWVGDKGIIHLIRDRTKYQFLHMPKRKVVFLLQVGEQKVKVDTANAFNEMHHPYGVVLAATYAKPASSTYIRLSVDTRDRRRQEAAQAAKEERAREATDQTTTDATAEDLEKLKKEDDRFAKVLACLPKDVTALLDTASFLLEGRSTQQGKAKAKAGGSDDDGEGSSASDAGGSDDSSSDAFAEDASEEDKRSEGSAKEGDEDMEEVGMEDKEFRPEAEDEGDDDESINELDMDFQNTRKAAQRYLESSREQRARHRNPTELHAYLEVLRELQGLVASATSGRNSPPQDGDEVRRIETLKEVQALLATPLPHLLVVNRFIAAADGMHGCELAFPAMVPVAREGEWQHLQETYGVGVSEAHYVRNFLTPPYKNVDGHARGLYKALSFVKREEYDRVLLLEGLLLARSVERRRHGILATQRPDVSDVGPIAPALRRLYCEESLWLRAGAGGAADVEREAARQLMVPAGRVVAHGNMVRVRGIQEVMRGGHAVLQAGSSAVRGKDAQQLWLVYQVGETLAREVGVFRRRRTNKPWVGAVTPHLTQVVNTLRGVYIPFSPTRATMHELNAALAGSGGLWVYEGADGEKLPLGALLGRLPELADGVEGTAKVRAQPLKALFHVDSDSDSESANGSGDDAAAVEVMYRFAEYQTSTQMSVQVLSGTGGLHEGESTTFQVFQQSPLERYLWDAGVTSPLLVAAVRAACQTEDGALPRMSELFWLLLTAEGDRDAIEGDLVYPWRFHSVFKRFGMTKRQAKVLKRLVDDAVDELLEGSRKLRTEIATRWAGMVRAKMFAVWAKLRTAFPQAKVAATLAGDAAGSDDDVAMDAADDIFGDAMMGQPARDVPPQPWDDASSAESGEAAGEDAEDETPCHGVDLHASSRLSEALREVMRCDGVGRNAVMHALRAVRYDAGHGLVQRYHWHEGQLIDVQGRGKGYGTMMQADAGRLAKNIIREAQKLRVPAQEAIVEDTERAPYLPDDAAAEDSDSDSDWDEYSLAESEDIDDDAPRRKKAKAADPLRADPFAVDGPLVEAYTAHPDDGAPFMGDCARCEVTLLNLYRFGDVLAERLATADPAAFKYASMNFRSQTQAAFADLFDAVLAAAHRLGVLKQQLRQRGDGAAASSPKVEEARERYMAAVRRLWTGEGIEEVEELEYAGEEEVEGSDDDSADDDASEAETAAPAPKFTKSRCKLGMCCLWDVSCAVSEELNVCEAVVQATSPFKFSVLESLRHRHLTEETVKALDVIPLSQHKQPQRVFDGAVALRALPEGGLGDVFAKLLHRQALLTDDATLLQRVAAAKGAEGNKVQFDVIRPYRAMYHGVSYGQDMETRKCPTFEAALAAAYGKKRCCAFSWFPERGEVVLKGAPKHTDKPYVFHRDAGALFCVIHPLRLYDGKWVPYGDVADAVRGDLREDKWRTWPEARRDPTDNQFYTEAEFTARHGKQGRAAWKAAVPHASSGVEMRRAPTRGPFESYAEYVAFEAENTRNGSQLPDGRFLTEAEFLTVYRKRAGQRLWAQAEPCRVDPESKRPMSLSAVKSDQRTGIDHLWNALPDIPPPDKTELERDPHSAPKLHVLRPTAEMLQRMGWEGAEDETEKEFTLYAGLRYAWVGGFVQAMEKAAAATFVREYGDFTTAAVWIFSVPSGSSMKTFEREAARYFVRHGIIKREDLMRSAFELSDYKLPDIQPTFAMQDLREVRLLADKSRNLQRLFKAREASFPEEVLRCGHNLRYRYKKNNDTINGDNLKSVYEIIASAGCRRIMTNILHALGIKNLKEAFQRAADGRFPAANFVKAYAAAISEDWSKPIPPASLAHAESLAAKAGWLPSEDTCKAIHGVLKLDGAQGILDWAVRAMMHVHKPLNLMLREVSQLVNVVLFTPTEVRYPKPSEAGTKAAEVATQRMLIDFELFDDSRSFEADGRDGDASAFDSMYVGHKVDPARVHVKYFNDSVDIPVVSDTGGRPFSINVYPIALVTDRPVRMLSYKLRHQSALQAVGWQVKAALVPHELAQKMILESSDLIQPDDCMEYDFTYMHRHTERLSRPIDEADFVPQVGHTPGRWVEGDRVEVYRPDAPPRADETNLDYGWTQGIVHSVDAESGVPTVRMTMHGAPDQKIAVPQADHLRHGQPTPTLREDNIIWYGAVPHTPGQWSSHIDIPDITPLIFANKQEPYTQRPHHQVYNWREVTEYEYADAKDGEIKRIKIAQGKTEGSGKFAVTRAGKDEGLAWEWGEYTRDANAYTFLPSSQGAPGAARHPSVLKFNAWLEDDQGGNVLGMNKNPYRRRAPPRMFLLSTSAETLMIKREWNYLGEYDLKEGQTLNGQAVWASTDETAWVFADHTGRWVVSTSLGGEPLLRSDQTCELLPGLCEFLVYNEDHGWVALETVFFETSDVKFEAHHVYLQLRRLGVDRARMNELGFDADDEEEARRELHNQLAMRLTAETRVADVWNRVRMIVSTMHRQLSAWENDSIEKHQTVITASIAQSMQSETARLAKVVRSMLNQDKVIEVFEFEKDEDDVIADAAAELGREYGYAREVVAHWARTLRLADGTLYHPNRREILNQFRLRYPAVPEVQAVLNTPEFLKDSDRCLRKREHGLWILDRWVPRLFALAREVLTEDVEAQGERSVPVVVGAFGFSRKKLQLLQIINGIPALLQEREALFEHSRSGNANRPQDLNPWWDFSVKKATHAPCVALAESLQAYFRAEMIPSDTREARRERAAALLASIKGKCPSPHIWLQVKLEGAFADYIRRIPRLPYWGTPLPNSPPFPAHYVNFDSAARGMALTARTPAPRYLVRRIEDEVALRWPPLFDADMKHPEYGRAIVLGDHPYVRRAKSRWVQAYRDHLINLEAGMDDVKALASKARRGYVKHRKLVARANLREGKRRFDNSGRRKRLKTAWKKANVVKVGSAALELGLTKEQLQEKAERQKDREERRKETQKAYRQTEAYKARKAEYRQREEVKARRAEYRQRDEVKAKKAEYRQRDEVKAKKAEYRQREDVKAKVKAKNAEYMKAYRQERHGGKRDLDSDSDSKEHNPQPKKKVRRN